MFSETLNHRSVAQTYTPNSRRRKIDDAARPQPRSSTRIPGRKSSAEVSHSVSQSEFAPPLTLARTHSGWYCEERGKLVEMNRWSEVTVPRFSHDALSGEANEEAQRKRSCVLLAWRLLTCSRLVSTNSRVGRADGVSPEADARPNGLALMRTRPPSSSTFKLNANPCLVRHSPPFKEEAVPAVGETSHLENRIREGFVKKS